jgi:hypothetical protein
LGYYLYLFCRIHIFLYFLYVWISFNGFTIDSLENYQVFKQKSFPLFVKTHKFAQNNYFLMTSDVSDRKLNKENQICNFSSFFNEKGILIEIWYSMNFCVKNVFWPLTLISEKLRHIFFWRPNYFESTNIAESDDIWHSRIVFMTIKFWKWCL